MREQLYRIETGDMPMGTPIVLQGTKVLGSLVPVNPGTLTPEWERMLREHWRDMAEAEDKYESVAAGVPHYEPRKESVQALADKSIEDLKDDESIKALIQQQWQQASRIDTLGAQVDRLEKQLGEYAGYVRAMVPSLSERIVRMEKHLAALVEQGKALESTREQWRTEWDWAGDYGLVRDYVLGHPVSPAHGSLCEALMRLDKSIEDLARQSAEDRIIVGICSDGVSALSERVSAIEAGKHVDSDEKQRRIYYQDIVYAVAKALDSLKDWHSGLTVCGTLESPSTQVQDRVVALVEQVKKLEERCGENE